MTADDRQDPIAAIFDVTEQAESRNRSRDRMLGTTLVTGRWFRASGVLVALLAVALFLPHSRGVSGIDVLLHTGAASDQRTSLPSYVFITLCAVGTIGFGIVALLTRRWWAAGIAWCATCIAMVYGLLSIWLRQSGRGPDPDFVGFGGPGIGLYLTEILVVALAIALGGVVWGRSREQELLQAEIRGGGD